MKGSQQFKWLIGTFLVIHCFSETVPSEQQTKKIRNAISHSPIRNDFIMDKIAASVMGESALIDKESGRIFWEGGSTSTIHASIAPFLGDLGLRHLKGTALSVLLLFAALSLLARYLRGRIAGCEPTGWPMIVLLAVIRLTILKVPKFDNWFLMTTLVCYLLEASTCNTRRYLTNAISSPDGVEEYIERLRNENPIVTWKVRCFHYERRWLAFLLAPQLLFRNSDMSGDQDGDRSLGVAPSGLLTKKVVTHHAEATYKFNQCHDNTIAGVWKRAELSNSMLAPFTKISLRKLLVLPNQKARLDYFQQQATFVTAQGQADEFAEFSTNIQVKGFKPRLLAVRSKEGSSSAKLFRPYLFWIFTCLGMSVPFRIWFARHCDMLRVTVAKETSPDKVSPSTSKSSSGWFKWSTSVDTSNDEVSPSKTFRRMMQELSLYGIDDNQTNEMVEVITAASALVAAAAACNETVVDSTMESLEAGGGEWNKSAICSIENDMAGVLNETTLSVPMTENQDVATNVTTVPTIDMDGSSEASS